MADFGLDEPGVSAIELNEQECMCCGELFSDGYCQGCAESVLNYHVMQLAAALQENSVLQRENAILRDRVGILENATKH
jgi:hypothetical protein